METAISLKLKYGSKLFYATIKDAFKSGHTVKTFKGAVNYSAFILNSPIN